jgi:hypothetical protein
MNHPLLAIGIDFLARTAASLLVALPLVGAVAASGVGHFPEGDRLLFQAGGLVLSDVARELVPALGPLLSTTLTTFVLLGALSIVPLAAVLAVLAEPGKLAVRSVSARAFASVPALLLVTGITLLAQVLVLGLAAAVGGFARQSLSTASPRLADGAFLALFGIGILGALVLGIARDLARSAAIQGAHAGRTALVLGLRALWSAPRAALQAFALRAVAGALLLAWAAVAAGALDVSRPESYRFALVLLLHQAAALGVAALRVSWFAVTLRCVEAGSARASGTHNGTQ